MITVRYLDVDGLPRAWADGPDDVADQVAECAADMIQRYVNKPSVTRFHDVARYTMHAEHTLGEAA